MKTAEADVTLTAHALAEHPACPVLPVLEGIEKGAPAYRCRVHGPLLYSVCDLCGDGADIEQTWPERRSVPRLGKGGDRNGYALLDDLTDAGVPWALSWSQERGHNCMVAGCLYESQWLAHAVACAWLDWQARRKTMVR